MKKEEKKIKKIVGLGGWLIVYLIFVFSLILGFLFLLIEDIKINLITSFELGKFIGSLIYESSILIFASYCIYYIFTKSKKAKGTNKSFLIFACIIQTLSIALGGRFFDNLIGIIIAIIWWNYWKESKRVKNTFIK